MHAEGARSRREFRIGQQNTSSLMSASNRRRRTAAANGGSAACAACKYQRRRCPADCQLAEFFPAERPLVFRNAHRLFGVSNILKTLDRVGPERRRDAMTTIIFEANAWEAYPAHGCVPFILELHQRVSQLQHDLDQVTQSVQAYRQALGGDLVQHAGDHRQLIIADEQDSLQQPWIQIQQHDQTAAPATALVPQPQQEDHNNIRLQTPDDMSHYFLDNIDEAS